MTVNYLSALGKAVFEKLVLAMGGQNRVYHYMAEQNPSYDYATYKIIASGPAEYHGTGAQNNVSWPVSVLIQIYSTSDANVGTKLQACEQQLHLLDSVDDGVIHQVLTTSTGPIEQMPDRDAQGRIIWGGSLLIEVLYGRSS